MSAVARKRRIPRRYLPLASGIGLLLAATIYVSLEGGLAEGFLDLRQGFVWAFRQFGAPVSLALLYIEESGLPLPVPGDVYVAILGHRAHGSISGLLTAWLAIIAVVCAGSTNLYLISRRWGVRIIEHPLARVFHMEPARLDRAKLWFDRWGVLAMIFGRHIPGFRVPLTVVAGTLRFPYRLFLPSVAVSTAIWAGVLLLVGDRFGRTFTRFASHNAWIYAVGTAFLLATIAYLAYRASRAMAPRRAGA